MVLHLIPEGYDSVEYEDIRLLPDDPTPKKPFMHEWASDPSEQTIMHVASGCRFRAVRLDAPRVQGLTLPFADASYEIVVKFAGMRDNAPRPSAERVRELGRQGLASILTYTYESVRRR